MNHWDNAPERFSLAAVYHEVAAVVGYDAAVEFGYQVWLHRRPPSSAGKTFGRGVIYVPRSLDDSRGSDLIRIAGRENAELLVARFRGSHLAFPSLAAAFVTQRNREIALMVQAGTRPAVVAALFGLTERQVRRVASTFNKGSSHHGRIKNA